MPIIATTFGGLDTPFLRKFFEPYYKKMRAHAKANGESEWEVMREKQHWLERFSAAIARGNTRMVGVAVSDSRLLPI